MHMFTPVNVMAVYERVTRRHAISQNDFVTYFNETAEELENTYGGAYVLLPEVYHMEKIETPEDGSAIDAVYENSLVNGILFLATGNADYRALYEGHASTAYLARWRVANKHKHIRGDVRK